MLMALFAIVPGAMMPERELVVAELASRKPACGMRIRVEARVWVCDWLSQYYFKSQIKVGGHYHVFTLHVWIRGPPDNRRVKYPREEKKLTTSHCLCWPLGLNVSKLKVDGSK
jgi:hypothetical protein